MAGSSDDPALRLPERTTASLVGLSGGLDSTVLLHLLSAQTGARARGLRAIHVHHGLQPEADAWVSHCRRLCAELALDLTVVEVQVSQHAECGPEAAARLARYQAFSAALRQDEQLLLAHHRDDQAETVVLRLMRASATRGLSAMRESRTLDGHLLLRPLLQVPRAALLQYANQHGLDWVEDPSNSSHAADRNFVRHRVLPVLGERWPNAAAALAQSAAWLAEDADLLREETQRRLAGVSHFEPDSLSVVALRQLSAPWRSRVLRDWITGLGYAPLPGSAFAVIDADLLTATSDGHPQYRWAGFALERWGDRLRVSAAAQTAVPIDWRLEWDGAQPLLLPTGDRLAFEALEPARDSRGTRQIHAQWVADDLGKLWVGTRQGGERIRLAGRKHSHSLKHCLQSAAVAPWTRQVLPLLSGRDDEVLAAGDLVISGRLQDFCLRHSLQLRWHRSPFD